MRHEIDEAIIATLSLQEHYGGFGSFAHEPGSIDFLASYVRACINTKQRALKVHEGLLDVVDRTAIQLMDDSRKSMSTNFENILFDICRMVLLSLGFNRVFHIISWEEQNQKRYHFEDCKNEGFHSVAYVLPAAIFLGMSGTANRLLDANPNLNVKNEYFWSPLCAAAYTGQKGLTQRLLDQGADPYFGPLYTPDPYPPFQWNHIIDRDLRYAPRAAAICGHDNILQILFRKKSPSILRRDTFKSFLMAAARSGRIETVQTIGRWDPLLFESQEVKEFLMYEACARGHTPMVKTMLEDGMSVDLFDIAPYDPQSPHRNQPRLDPLKVAASFGRLETVRLLLEHGAPLQRSEERRWPTRITALGLAGRYGFRQVSDLLIQHGADLYAGKLKPLDCACSEGQAHIVRLLLTHGCRVDESGSTESYSSKLLWRRARLAITNGRPSVADILREFGVPELFD